jgi:class 3 adenylate cyclase
MHAFLFADLRGYTQFAATRGDRAAAQLLDRYRSLVRAQVARHAGAEVRTEGDSFYILFISVSEAVQCALAIAAAARQASLDDPALPLNVGIGVHFGETVDTAEGSVGSAVNLAARLASAAGANEVLVSDVVRSLLRGTPEVRIVAVGTRRLKGFSEPVAVYRATTDYGAPIAARRSRRLGPVRAPVLLGALGAALALVLAMAWIGTGGLTGPTASPSGTQLSQSASPSTSPSAPGEVAFTEGLLEPGTYVDRDFVPNVRIELVDKWCGGLSTVRRLTTKPGPDLFYMFAPGSDILQNVAGDPCASSQREPDAGFLSLNRVAQVYGPTACDDGVTRSIASWDALVGYLTTLPGTSVSNRASASFGGVLGVGFDLHVDAGTVCPQSGAPTRAVLIFPTTTIDRAAGQPRVAAVWWGEGQYIRLWVVDVGGQLVVGSLGHELSSEPVSQIFIEKAYRVLQSLRFVSAS